MSLPMPLPSSSITPTPARPFTPAPTAAASAAAASDAAAATTATAAAAAAAEDEGSPATLRVHHTLDGSTHGPLVVDLPHPQPRAIDGFHDDQLVVGAGGRAGRGSNSKPVVASLHRSLRSLRACGHRGHRGSDERRIQ